MMFAKEYSYSLVFSAVITLFVVLILIRLYLKLVNKPSNIQKPEWMSEDKFKKTRGKPK